MHPALVLALDYLFIFGARVADVSLGTIRFMMMVRGRRSLAAAISFFEIIIWVTALSRVLSGLDNPLKVVVYSLGFATGVFVGQWVEEKIALGVSSVQIIPRRPEAAALLRDTLRAEGYGVTVIKGEGRDGERSVLLVTSPRRGIAQLLAAARQADPEAFITILDARAVHGGTLRLGRAKSL